MKAFLKYYIKDRLVLSQQKRDLKRTNQAPVLIFTMAKVGSLSVYQSLKRQTDLAVFHIHSLDVAEVEKHIDLCKEKGVYPGSRSPIFLINENILENQSPYKVISLFRNPIERNLSAFFEAFEIHMGVRAHLYKGSLEEIERAFHTKLDHNYCKIWYKSQFIEGTGIDVYNAPFDKEKGYCFISGDNKDVLLLKSSLEDSMKEKLIGDFCNLDSFTIKNVNITNTKKEANLYSGFKKHIRFSREYLESQLETPFVHHFFNEQEKIGLYNKWLK